MKTYSENTKLAEIPAEAFGFNFVGEVAFADEGEEKNNLRLTLYDGGVVKHFYWGNLAFDLSGIKLLKPRIPILFAHDPEKRLGFSTRAIIDDKFVVEGELLKNSPVANEIRRDSKDGFPFEASLRFDPLKTKPSFIKEGEKVTVNGQTLEGPGTVMSQTCVIESSIAVLGKLSNTRATIFGLEKLETTDSETLESFAQQQPVLYDAVLQEGRKKERVVFAEFADRFKDDPGFCIEQYVKGKTLDEAAAIYPSHKQKIDPADLEFSDDQKPPDDKEPTDFESAVKQCMEKEKCSEAKAIRFCVAKFPALYDSYKKKLEEESE